MKYAREIMLMGVVIVFSIVGIEITLQLLDYPPRPAIGWNWKASVYKDETFTSDQVNEFGYRGQPIKYDDGDFVVLLLGDSFIESGVQRQVLQPERILQFTLQKYGIANAKVFSLASAGWSVDQELIALQHYFSRYRADAVVHWMTPGNDFWEAGNIDRSFTSVPGPLKPTFVLADDGTLSRYSVSAFGFKIPHLVQLFLNRLRDPNWGNSSIAVNEYEKHLPSTARIPVSRESCPDPSHVAPSQERTEVTGEAVERSRSHYIVGILPRSDRDNYFVNLTYALQKQIETETTSRQSTYLPIVVYEKKLFNWMTRLRCIIEVESGLAYRYDWNVLVQTAHNRLLRSAINEIFIDTKWFSFVSERDLHFNMLGNFEALNQVARAIIERRNSNTVQMISTEDLVYSSKLLASAGAVLSFMPGGQSTGQPVRGFYAQEGHGRWTNGDAEVMFAMDGQIAGNSEKVKMELKVDGYGLIAGPQTRSDLEIIVDGKPVGEFAFTQQTNNKLICLEFELAGGKRLLSVGLRSKPRARPVDIGLGGDDRVLGFLVRSMQILSAHKGSDCD